MNCTRGREVRIQNGKNNLIINDSSPYKHKKAQKDTKFSLVFNSHIKERDSYERSVYGDNFSRYSNQINEESNLIEVPIETSRYRLEDASYVDGIPAYEILDKETGRLIYIREKQLSIQKDQNTGLEFLINPDQPISSSMPVTSELKGIISELCNKKGINVDEIPLQYGLTVNQDDRTGLKYLTYAGNEAKGMSLIVSSKNDLEKLNRLSEEFIKYSVSSQKSTAVLYALLEVSGNLRRGSDGFTYLTPNGITYIPYDGNPQKAWEMDILSSDYDKARKYLLGKVDFEDYRVWKDLLTNTKIYFASLPETVVDGFVWRGQGYSWSK